METSKKKKRKRKRKRNNLQHFLKDKYMGDIKILIIGIGRCLIKSHSTYWKSIPII